jgi:hypothetical protein
MTVSTYNIEDMTNLVVNIEVVRWIAHGSANIARPLGEYPCLKYNHPVFVFLCFTQEYNNRTDKCLLIKIYHNIFEMKKHIVLSIICSYDGHFICQCIFIVMK